jgi:Rieske Fe-S protein
MANPQEVSRRDFIRFITLTLGATIGAVIALPAIGYIVTPAVQTQEGEAWIPAGPLENYPPGVPTLFNFTRTRVNGWEKTTNSYGVFVLRQEGDQVLALSNICTHLSCRVNWKADLTRYTCPCHDAQFDIDGQVVYGPPPRPMDEYETKIEEGILYIHYGEGGHA